MENSAPGARRQNPWLHTTAAICRRGLVTSHSYRAKNTTLGNSASPTLVDAIHLACQLLNQAHPRQGLNRSRTGSLDLEEGLRRERSRIERSRSMWSNPEAVALTIPLPQTWPAGRGALGEVAVLYSYSLVRSPKPDAKSISINYRSRRSRSGDEFGSSSDPGRSFQLKVWMCQCRVCAACVKDW